MTITTRRLSTTTRRPSPCGTRCLEPTLAISRQRSATAKYRSLPNHSNQQPYQAHAHKHPSIHPLPSLSPTWHLLISCVSYACIVVGCWLDVLDVLDVFVHGAAVRDSSNNHSAGSNDRTIVLLLESNSSARNAATCSTASCGANESIGICWNLSRN
jgi:hypothetical protein